MQADGNKPDAGRGGGEGAEKNGCKRGGEGGCVAGAVLGGLAPGGAHCVSSGGNGGTAAALHSRAAVRAGYPAAHAVSVSFPARARRRGWCHNALAARSKSRSPSSGNTNSAIALYASPWYLRPMRALFKIVLILVLALFALPWVVVLLDFALGPA